MLPRIAPLNQVGWSHYSPQSSLSWLSFWRQFSEKDPLPAQTLPRFSLSVAGGNQRLRLSCFFDWPQGRLSRNTSCIWRDSFQNQELFLCFRHLFFPDFLVQIWVFWSPCLCLWFLHFFCCQPLLSQQTSRTGVCQSLALRSVIRPKITIKEENE